jgi:hypothetical protein
MLALLLPAAYRLADVDLKQYVIGHDDSLPK